MTGARLNAFNVVPRKLLNLVGEQVGETSPSIASLRSCTGAAMRAVIDHGFTHFDLRLQPLRVRCSPTSQVREAGDRLWYALSSPPKVGLPQPIHQLFERMLNARAVA